MPTEREKMLAGELYDPLDADLVAERLRAREICFQLNRTGPHDAEERDRLTRDLFGAVGPNLWFEPPFFCDYGTNIRLGERVFFNFNCVFLDVAEITIGDRTLLGPAVQLYAATHPVDAETRARGLELGYPIRIGSDCWIGGGTIVCPGVTIGDRTVIGAGSVVTKDIPSGVIAVGNPCRVLRPLGA